MDQLIIKTNVSIKLPEVQEKKRMKHTKHELETIMAVIKTWVVLQRSKFIGANALESAKFRKVYF